MKYLKIERCVQCPNNTYLEGGERGDHYCMSQNKHTGLSSDAIPDWCPLPELGEESYKKTRIHATCNLCDNLIVSSYEMTDKSKSGYLVDCLKKSMKNCPDFEVK